MSTHPNAILAVALTPDNLARKTYRDILEYCPKSDITENLLIGDKEYKCILMEGDYSDLWQISAKEGDIVVFEFITYGYGETVDWDVLDTQKQYLEIWVKDICERFNCSSYRIFVTANYW